MFNKHTSEGCKDAFPKIKHKTLVFGEITLMTEFQLDDNSTLPEHSHPYEQTGYLVKGHILLIIGDTRYDAYHGVSPTELRDSRRFGRNRDLFSSKRRLSAQGQLAKLIHRSALYSVSIISTGNESLFSLVTVMS